MTCSYIGGHYLPTHLDVQVLDKLDKANVAKDYVHLSRWIRHIESFERSEFVQVDLDQRVSQ